MDAQPSTARNPLGVSGNTLRPLITRPRASTFCQRALAFAVLLVLGVPLCGLARECSADEVVIGGVDENDDYGASLAVAPDGTAWVVWTGIDPVGLDEEIYYSTNDGNGWAPQTRLHGENASADRYPHMSIGPDGVAWVIWAGRGNYTWASHWTSSGWSTPEAVRAGTGGYDYDICALGQDNVWVATRGQAPERSGDVILVYHRDTQGWNGPWTIGWDGHNGRNPDLRVASDGRPWLVWIAWLPGDYVGPVLCSSWADTGWAAAQVVNGDTGNSGYPQLVFDGETPTVLWEGNYYSTRDIECSRFENGAWTPAIRVNLPDGRYDGDENPSCDVGSGGRIAVAWVARNDFVSLDADVMVSWWEGGHWTDEQELSRPGPHKEDLFPSAAVAHDGTLWAAWECYEEIAPPWDTDIRGVTCVPETPVSFGVLRTIFVPGRGVRVSWYADGEAASGPFYVWRSLAGADSAALGPEPLGDAVRLNQEPIVEGPYEWVDHGLVPGATYNYWVEWDRSSGASYLGPATVVLDAPQGATATVLSVNPNPSRGGNCFPHEQYREGTPELVIFTVGGREVARVSPGKLGAGRHDAGEGILCWPGTTHSGVRVPSGVYVWQLLFDGERVEGERGLVTVVR